jgi:NADPH-dependent glutamate synthase beta subunit-like oxidoreductase/coenzyme F420-reducing hydrogenase delta subunit
MSGALTDPKEAAASAPCTAACPVHTDTRRLVELIVAGRYEDALELLLDANPFSSVCGRICHHPCEQGCRRATVDAPVGLMRLKRFVMETAQEYRRSRRDARRIPQDKQKVAIIGSGPSGMTAAADLARRGYRPVVFERSSTPGGLLGDALPRYRLPYSVVMEDIQDILSLGVELRTDVHVGKDVMLSDLLEGGFAAVLVATGLSESRAVAIPGIDSAGVLLALPFLRSARSQEPLSVGRRVAVIGGGNVAIDVGRTARRLGAEKVTLVCLEAKDEMPASSWEIEEAEEEGVQIMPSWGPRCVFSDNGEVKGLELKKCTAVFDGNGRFRPQYDESDMATIVADNIIIAVGQQGDLGCLEGSPVELVGPGRMKWDRETLATSVEGVFACGEVAAGPGSAVEAVFDGHRAAKSITHYLEHGQPLKQPYIEWPHIGELPDDVAKKVTPLSPSAVDVVPPEARVKDFSELDRAFTEGEALAEAKRCLACTTGALADEEKCAACLTCVRVCPFGVATIDKTAIMPAEKCQACGLCAAYCPAAAIALKRFGTNQMRGRLTEIVWRKTAAEIPAPLIVSYCCLFEVSSREFARRAEEDYLAQGIVPIMIPCVARLSVADLLSPFEVRAEAVVVIACQDGACLYPTAEERLLDRVRQAKQILSEIGMEPERIDYWKTDGKAESSWAAFWQFSRRKIQQLQAAEMGGRV